MIVILMFSARIQSLVQVLNQNRKTENRFHLQLLMQAWKCLQRYIHLRPQSLGSTGEVEPQVLRMRMTQQRIRSGKGDFENTMYLQYKASP